MKLAQDYGRWKVWFDETPGPGHAWHIAHGGKGWDPNFISTVDLVELRDDITRALEARRRRIEPTRIERLVDWLCR